MSEKLSIKLKILERTYPLLIDWNEEEKLREASKRINDMVIRFKQHYADKDNQDLLAMVCLQFASKLLDVERSSQDKKIDAQLEQMCEELDEFIKINQQ